jgi:hypothetical protein
MSKNAADAADKKAKDSIAGKTAGASRSRVRGLLCVFLVLGSMMVLAV